MVCLLKNKENKALLNKYAKVVGSEEAAYYLLAANNGFLLKYTPNGEDSALFNALLQKNNGDEAAAIMDKAVAYLPEYILLNGDWIEGKGKSVDSKGEPKITDVLNQKICDSSSISNILQDKGKQKKAFELLQDENLIERFYPIGYAMKNERDIFISDYLQHMLSIAPFGPLGKYINSNSARETWDKKKQQEIVAETRRKLAEAFGLTGYIDGKTGRIVYETEDSSADAQLRVDFVNSIGQEHKGKYTDKEILDAQMSMIEIAVLDGDHTTFVHEMAHHYVRTFWNTEPVQQALKECGVVDKDKSVEVEEKLVEALVDRLYGIQESENKPEGVKARLQARWEHFWDGLNNYINEKLGKPLRASEDIKNNVIDILAAHFAVNKDLSALQAEQEFFVKELVPVFQSSAVNVSEQDKSAFGSILDIIEDRIKSAEHASNYTKLDIATMKIQRNKILHADLENDNDIYEVVKDLVSQCNVDLANLATVIANARTGNIRDLDIKSMMQLKVDVLGYYTNIFSENLLADRFNHSLLQAFQRGGFLFQQFNEALDRLSRYLREFDSIIADYVDNTIDVYSEYLMDFGDKEVFKQNMKYWSRNQIQNGGLSVLEEYLGSAITSRSPIIRLMDYMVREAKGVVQRDALTKAHELQEVYKNCRPAGSDLFTIKNYMKNFIEVDEDGQPTGNFKREYNYGRVRRDIEKATIEIAAKVGITLDDNLKADPRDPKYMEFADKLDDWFEENPHIVRRYTPRYYKARRRFLSQDTIDYKNDIQDKIDNLLLKMTDPDTGVKIPSRLTATERDEYRKLVQEKLNLSSFYYIIKDDTGKIIRFEEKPVDSDAYRIAQELSSWNNFLKGQIKYTSNKAKYNEDLQKLINKYGANSTEVKSFEYEFTASRITQEFYDLLGQSGNDLVLSDLLSRRASIVNSVKSKSGYYTPDLSKLNDESIAELKRIDEEIAAYKKNANIKSTGNRQAFENNARKDWVKHIENGQITQESEINFLEEQARRANQTNPNSLLEFYDKYYYTNEKDKLVPLSAFSMTVVNPTSTNGTPLVDYSAPVGIYSEIDESSDLVDDRFDTSDRNYALPWKNKASKYYNKSFSMFDPTSKDYDLKAKEAYDTLIRTMKEALNMIPGLDPELVYQMPQIRDTNLRRWCRHGLGRMLGNAAIKIGTLGITDYESLKDIDVNETDTQYNEEFAKRPDGTYVTSIPLRWISRLKDTRDISTDVFGSVAMFYEMAKNYQELEKIEPVMDAFLFNMKGGFASNTNETDQSKRLENYIDMYIHGRMRKGFAKNAKMSKQELRAAKLADALMGKTHSKLMGHNWRTVLKNAMDSAWNLTKEIIGGKYFTVQDAFRADKWMFKECIDGTALNLGRGNTGSMIAGLMQYNGVEGSIKESFGEQRSSWIRRVLQKHLHMGEYSLVDYTFKGKITAMVYEHHRLIVNPSTGQQEFMNREQVIYNYVKHGYTEKQAIEDWSKSETSLKDAYTLTKNGNIVLKKQYEDAVRPYVPALGRRSNKLETRIATIIKERAGVINGVLDSMDRSKISLNYLGAMAVQMRGWMIALSLDNFKSGNDFGDYYSMLGSSKTKTVSYGEIEDLKELKGLANISTGYLENGALRGLIKAYLTAVSNILHLNRLLNSPKLTRQQRYQVRMMNVSFIAFAVTVGLGILFGKSVEGDDEDKLSVFGYAVNAGAMSERTSGLPAGIVVSMLELLRSPGAVTAMYNDAGSIFDLAGDGINYMNYQQGWSYDATYAEIVNRGSYKGLEKWQKDLLKASSILTPDLSYNNIYKNLSKDANMASARWYNQQFPVNIFNYIPQIGTTKKTNIVTNQFNESDIYGDDKTFFEFVKDLVVNPWEK